MRRILTPVKTPLTSVQFHVILKRMTATAMTSAGIGWPAPKNGATLAFLMASYYPIEEETEGERVRTSVRLPPAQHDDLELIAELWNEMDKALGRRRPRKWKPASVIERLISVGIDGFWGQVGGRPATKAGRADFIKQAIERLKSRQTRPSRE